MELNNELLKEEPDVPKSPKRNTKSALIRRILELSDKLGFELKESDSQLKRMSKESLQKKLGKHILFITCLSGLKKTNSKIFHQDLPLSMHQMLKMIIT